MDADPENQGKTKDRSVPVATGKDKKNSLPGTTKKDEPPKEAFLWIRTKHDEPINDKDQKTHTQNWQEFCSKAVLTNKQGGKYESSLGLALNLGSITNHLNSWKKPDKQPVFPVDHLIINGHGWGMQECYDKVQKTNFYRDRGYFWLDYNKNSNGSYQVNENPKDFGTDFNDESNLTNMKFREMCEVIKTKGVKHIHLHTCYTGRGWYFLRRFSMLTNAIIYAYYDYVGTSYVTDNSGTRNIQRVLQNPPNEPYSDKYVTVYGVYEKPGPFSCFKGLSRTFQKVLLHVESTPSKNNNGMMVLPGWQVRAYPSLDANKQPDAVIEVYDRSTSVYSSVEKKNFSYPNGSVNLYSYLPQSGNKWIRNMRYQVMI